MSGSRDLVCFSLVIALALALACDRSIGSASAAAPPTPAMPSHWKVISDIDSRRVVRVILGKVPVGEMFGYATRLRSLTQGRGTYSMQPAGYQAVPAEIGAKIEERRRLKLRERRS